MGFSKPVFSPGGRRLAYATSRAETPRLRVLDLPSGDSRDYGPLLKPACDLVWLSDDVLLAFEPSGAGNRWREIRVESNQLSPRYRVTAGLGVAPDGCPVSKDVQPTGARVETLESSEVWAVPPAGR